MKVRLLQDPFLKSEKHKREPIPIPIVETKVTHPGLKTKPKRERKTSSLPWFKTEILDSESETDSLPIHSEYINPFRARADLSASAVLAKNAGGRCIGPFLSRFTVAVPYIGC